MNDDKQFTISRKSNGATAMNSTNKTINEDMKQPLISPYGWRKAIVTLIIVGLSTLLCILDTPKGEPMLSGVDWAWFNIRLAVLYMGGNVGAKLVDTFGAKKDS